ncbi:NAD(P)H-hydrate epimerase [Gurleya vavrai]
MPNFEFDYVIDALFGINQRKEIEEPWLGIINSLKEHDRVIAVDVPSGCDIDSDEIGIYRPFCVVTFVAPKICCRNLKCFVTRSFVPKEIFYDEKYTNFCTYVEIT